MDFHETGLPDKQLFRDAFTAGWARYVARNRDSEAAAREYRRGPIALARLIFGHGGERHQLAAAACLAGPSLFSDHPADGLDKRLVEFSAGIRAANNCPAELLGRIIPRLSADTKLFLQATSIMLLEHLAQQREGCAKSYSEALDLYSAARGFVDTYRLDTRFEIAAMKASTLLVEKSHIWAKAPRTPQAAGPV